MGVLKLERQNKLGCANANEHDEHAGKVDGKGRICKAATSSSIRDMGRSPAPA